MLYTMYDNYIDKHSESIISVGKLMLMMFCFMYVMCINVI